MLIIVIIINTKTHLPFVRAVSDLVYAASGAVVHTTICDGEVLMYDRRVEVVDEAEVIAEAREAAFGLTGQ